MSFLVFQIMALGNDRKTKQWAVNSHEGVPLGIINWYSHWRRYAFQPNTGTVYDMDCLREIADFCGTQTEAHKVTWKG